MEETGKKGTVTSLASMFPVEEALKAAKRVQETIYEKKKDLGHLQDFVAENSNLVNLVKKLPEELNHDIMVPFGKAAFFPGRLIHTNEFLVLLGEGYYVERTSKQTIEILKRRENSLESQVDSLEAMIKDLKAKASFFDTMASEAAEGLVEIREDYVDENSSGWESKPVPTKQNASIFPEAENERVVDDEEYARMISRLDELENEELAAEKEDESDKNEKDTAQLNEISYQKELDYDLRDSENFRSKKSLEQTSGESIATAAFPNKHNGQGNLTDDVNYIGLPVESSSRDEPSEQKKLENNMKILKSSDKSILPREVKENVQAASTSRSEVQLQSSKPAFDSHKAFTGSIVERTENLQTSKENSTSSQVSSIQPSKPVSRFKMQRK